MRIIGSKRRSVVAELTADEVTKELLSTKGTLIYQLLKVFEILITAEFGQNIRFLLMNYDPKNKQTYEDLKCDPSLREKSSKYITDGLLVTWL